MIEFVNVTKKYESGNKQVTAVSDVDLHVEEGKICVLLGPSGCGKTTLLRMVNRLIPLTSGKIIVNGKDINEFDPIELRRSIGYVIQQIGLFPNMTIKDNINVITKLLGWEKEKMDQRYTELMEMVGLNPKEYRDRHPWELSGGQQQRVGVARALAADPPVMLMDEPFGALDPIMREQLQNEFLNIQKNVKKTILLVSHDIDEAIKLGDTIAIFGSGHLMQHDTPEEILTNPKNDYIREFVGGDRILKSLSLMTVQHLMDQLPSQPPYDKEITSNIRLDMNLRTALSIILSTPNGVVRVIGPNEKPIGVLSLADFEYVTGEGGYHAGKVG